MMEDFQKEVHRVEDDLKDIAFRRRRVDLLCVELILCSKEVVRVIFCLGLYIFGGHGVDILTESGEKLRNHQKKARIDIRAAQVIK